MADHKQVSEQLMYFKIYSVYSGYNQSHVKRLEAIKVRHTETQASKYRHQCELSVKQLEPQIPGCRDGVEHAPLITDPPSFTQTNHSMQKYKPTK